MPREGSRGLTKEELVLGDDFDLVELFVTVVVALLVTPSVVSS